MGLFVSSYDHLTFIGGSTSFRYFPYYSPFEYSDYNTEDICGRKKYLPKSNKNFKNNKIRGNLVNVMYFP